MRSLGCPHPGSRPLIRFVSLDFSIVNVALPSIQENWALQPRRCNGSFTGYAITFRRPADPGGRAADLFGAPAKLFVAGLFVVTASSLAAALAQDLTLAESLECQCRAPGASTGCTGRTH